jgi:Mg2+ and Co2+ transporter CorA
MEMELLYDEFKELSGQFKDMEQIRVMLRRSLETETLLLSLARALKPLSERLKGGKTETT